MPDDAKAPDLTTKVDQANAEEIKRNEATDPVPRGNVYSEKEEGGPAHEAPPALPN